MTHGIGASPACRKQPVSCREQDIGSRYGLKPNKRKPWQFEGKCPVCKHGGFSLAAGSQGPNPPRHIWYCNCHRCRCDPAVIRAQMISDGISEDCLGWYKRNTAKPAQRDPADALRAAMLAVLADPKVRAPADLKLRMLEVIEGRSAPADWDGFIAFAARAGVQRSKRYEAAARWGRSATEVVPEPEQ
jgi:hypothetical protein